MSPSLYDLFNVDASADPAQIRTAWRSAIADLDPGDRRFAMYNEAAGTLLDPDKRAAYDAILAPEPTPVEQPSLVEPVERPPELVEVTEPVGQAPYVVDYTSPVEPVEPVATPVEASKPGEPHDDPDPASEPKEASRPLAGARDTSPSVESKPSKLRPEPHPTKRRAPSLVVLIALMLLATVALAGTVYTWTRPGADKDNSAAAQAERSQAGAEAEAAAQKAAGPVLSYDYRKMPESIATAAGYLSDDLAADQKELLEKLTPDAVKQRAVVTANVLASGITRAQEDRADIVVFVNQDTIKGKAEPFVLKMWATLRMVKTDGRWLVDDIVTDGLISQ